MHTCMPSTALPRFCSAATSSKFSLKTRDLGAASDARDTPACYHSCVTMIKPRGWAYGPLSTKYLAFGIWGSIRNTLVHQFPVRDMDGLVLCAVERHRRCRGFEPCFSQPSRRLLAMPPPQPPSAARSTTGTAGGWVVCLVVISFLLCNTPHHKMPQHHTCSSAPRHRRGQPTAGASRRILLLLQRSSTGNFDAAAGSTISALRLPTSTFLDTNTYGCCRQTVQVLSDSLSATPNWITCKMSMYAFPLMLRTEPHAK